MSDDTASQFRSRLNGFGPLQDWEFDANCIDAPVEWFFGTPREDDDRPNHSARRTKAQTAKAKALCDACSVFDACRTWAIEQGPPHGYIANLTEADRIREGERLGITPDKRKGPAKERISGKNGIRNGTLRQTLPTMTGSIDRWSSFQGQSSDIGRYGQW